MSDEAYARLQDAIISGELPPGERLRDYDLAERLGTSKTPIRHALDRLVDDGLVEMQRNRYTRVAPIDLDRVRNAIDLFGDIWIGSLRHGMPVLEDADIAHLTALADELVAAARVSDVSGSGTALRSLATTFARIEGNGARAAAIERLDPQIRRFVQHARDAFDDEEVSACVGALRAAMIERDVVETRSALVTLFDDVLSGMIDRAEERGLVRSSPE